MILEPASVSGRVQVQRKSLATRHLKREPDGNQGQHGANFVSKRPV